jgi:hypothetical protein
VSTYALLYTIELTVVSDGDDRTAFLATVYKKYNIPFKHDEVVVGSLTDTIGGILTKSKNGGTKILCTILSCFTDAISSDQSARSASWRRYFRSA